MRRLKVVIPLLVGALLLLMVWSLCAFQIVVSSASSEPLLLSGDRVLVKRTVAASFLPLHRFLDRALYSSGAPNRGDLLAFSNPAQAMKASHDGALLIGKCTALAGDTVWLPWHTMSEPYPTGPRLYPFIVPGRNITVAIRPWNILLIANTLHLHEGANVCVDCDTALVVDGFSVSRVRFSKDYIWVSTVGHTDAPDSRTFGPVPLDCLKGKLAAVTWSHNPDEPFYRGFRTERFFRPVSALQKALK